MEMTHAEEIMHAVAALVKQGKKIFSRREIRDQIGVDQDKWMASYTAIFQGMRADQPGGAPKVGSIFKGVFLQVERGIYSLTEYGGQLLKEFPPRKDSRRTYTINEQAESGIFIFVSYATKDSTRFQIPRIAERLTEYPEIKDVLYWEEDLHDDIIAYMNENLGKCDVFILFCSPNALESEPVEMEWGAALKIGKKIIPVFMDETHIPPLLSTKLGVSFREKDFDGTIGDIYRLIIKKLEIKVPQHPGPSVPEPTQTEPRPPEEAKVLKDLETLIEKSIPLVNSIDYDTFGKKVEGDHILGLGLYGCGLTTLPESFGQLKSLQTLEMYENQLTSLPESFGQLKSLQILGIPNNQLTTLPESFGALQSLQELALGSNQLTSLPASFGELKSLEWLSLISNKLTSLPASFGQLKSLQTLEMYENQLTSLPASFLNLSSITRLIISDNPLGSRAKKILKKLKKKGVSITLKLNE